MPFSVPACFPFLVGLYCGGSFLLSFLTVGWFPFCLDFAHLLGWLLFDLCCYGEEAG